MFWFRLAALSDYGERIITVSYTHLDVYKRQGFIWDFIDQAILVKDQVTGKEVLRYGGDFDDKPSDYELSLIHIFSQVLTVFSLEILLAWLCSDTKILCR